MQNPAAPYQSGGCYNEEDKYFDNNLTSAIDNDYILNYLDNSESGRRGSFQIPNLFNNTSHDIPLTNFHETHNSGDALQGLYGKFSVQEPWMSPGPNETSKPNSDPSSATFNTTADPDEVFDGSIKTKKIKTNKATEVKKIAEISKNNIKNTYINKINSLITEPKESKSKKGSKSKAENNTKDDLKRSVEMRDSVPFSQSLGVKMGIKKVKSCDLLKSDELEKLNVKLAKNRESARNSRIRKKVYIELLEKTVDQLQQELIATRKQLEISNNNANKANLEAKPIANLFTGKQQLFERLERMVTTKADESEISFLIDSIRLRFGASGRERVDAVNFMFKQIMEFLVPVHMKYLLWTAGKGKDLFNNAETLANMSNGNPSENTEYWNSVSGTLNFTENQRRHLLKYRKKLLAEKEKFKSLVTTMNQIRKGALKQVNSLQIVIDEFRNYMTPTQTGLLLVVLEKEKNRKELSADKLWTATTNKKDQYDLSGESDTFLEGEDLDQESDDEGMDFSQNISNGTGTPAE